MGKQQKARLNVMIYSVIFVIIGFVLSIAIPIINGIDVGNFVFLGMILLILGIAVWSFRTMDKKDRERGSSRISNTKYYTVIIAVAIGLLIMGLMMATIDLMPDNPNVSRQEINEKDVITTVGIIILLVAILVYDKYFKKNRGGKGGTRHGWTEIEKEEVRERQGGVCNKCGRTPPRWEYHHRDGHSSNNSMSNCEGLCPNCHSVKTYD